MNVSELRGFDAPQVDGTRRHLELCSTLRDDVLKRHRAAADSSSLLSIELDRARLANALGVSDDLQQALSEAASLAAAMTVRARIRGGHVAFTSSRDVGLLFPDGDTDASLPLWLDGLACAVIVHDTTACQYLADIIALESVLKAASKSGRPVGNEPFWPEYGRAFIALVQGEPIAVAHAQRARQQIATGPTGVLVREGLEAIDMPVLQLIEIISARDTAKWSTAVQNALERFHKLFTSEGYTNGLPGYLPLGLLAVCSVARQRGFPFPKDSPYLPEISITGATHLDVRFPLQAILSADEAHWFFDLQGYLRTGRKHRLVDQNGALVARYEVAASAGLPPASADFAVVDSELPKEKNVPFALDAGQLLFLAQSFASQLPADSGVDASTTRILLNDAVACVDAALARIPAGSDVVPPDTIHSEEGTTILADEPGRFRRARLNAYRAGLASQVSSVPEATRSTRDDFLQMLQSIETSIEVIRVQALPVLEAFAQDRDGTFALGLQPREEDYDKVFVGEAAGRARETYHQLWSRGMQTPKPHSMQTEIRCAVAPAGMFTWRNELSEQFPGGYQGIASMFNPHYVWLAWQYVERGKPSGLSFDGLVWVDDHWAWFPKPYRYLVRENPA